METVSIMSEHGIITAPIDEVALALVHSGLTGPEAMQVLRTHGESLTLEYQEHGQTVTRTGIVIARQAVRV